MTVNAAAPSLHQHAMPIEVPGPEGPKACSPPASLAPPIAASGTTRVEVRGRSLLSLAGCDYLGLSHHPAVLEAARTGLERFGLSTTASRVTTGNTEAHEALERDLCRLLRQPDAVIVPEGYTANLALCQALARRVRHALVDERAHRSLHDAIRASGLQPHIYAHRNAPDAGRLLDHLGTDAAAIFTDGVFTADGTLAPIAGLLGLLREDDVLVVDDCHGVGVLAGGRGTCVHLAVEDERIVITTTLAKALGCYGGAVLGPTAVVRDVRQHSTAFICTTPIPPAVALAASAAIRIVEQDVVRHRALARNTAQLRAIVAAHGAGPGDGPTPIVSFAFDDADAMGRLHEGLAADGIMAPLIRYPGGPSPRYFRLTVSADHTPNDLAEFASSLSRHWPR